MAPSAIAVVSSSPRQSAGFQVHPKASPLSATLDGTSSDLDLVEVHVFLCDLARRAGAMILAATGDSPDRISASVTKNNTSDRVTETDRAVEAMVQRVMAEQYPMVDFLGEETFKAGQKLSDRPTFVVDPIDGTLNFIHGFPNVAVSLCLTISRRPVIGVVFNPFRDDLFSAVKGRGAFLSRGGAEPSRLGGLDGIKPAPLPSLNSALVAIEWGNQRTGPNWDLRSSVAMKLLSAKSDGGAMVHSIRSSGSAALDFCYVAAGWFDAFWEGGCWVWDVCAGWLIVEETGGIVVGANPNEYDPTLEGRSYFCVRATEKREEQLSVVQGVWKLMGDRRFNFAK